MALKKILTPDEHKKLAPALQSEYKESDGSFVLDIEGGDDDWSALKRAKDHEKKARQTAEAKARELETQLTALTEERDGLLKGAIPKADVDKLEGSYKAKLVAKEKELSDQIGTLNGQLTTMLVDNVATGLASKISTSPEVILPHIKSRLRAEQVEGKFITRIIDGEGKPTALTIQDLEKEFVANKAFAPIITGSKASGGGAGGGGSGGSAPGKIDYTKSPKEIAAQLKASGKIQVAAE